MPPSNMEKDVEMERSEDDWVDEEDQEQIHDDEDDDIDAHDYQDEDDQDPDDDEEALARLSEQYRRYSEHRRARDQHEHDNDDSSSEHNDDDDDHDDHDPEDDENPLANALRALGQVRGGNRPADGEGGNARARSLAENMARIFPEFGLLGGFGGGVGGGTRISALVEGLNRRDDPYLVLETLNELSERLLMMNAVLAERGIPDYPLAKALVAILNEPMYQEELELQLVACRCLYNFLEVNPDYIHTAVSAGAIEALQTKLLEISYIDLAEQALQTLEMISRVCGSLIFTKRCLGSVLQYLDFFTIHAQRKCINIVANSVKYIKQTDFDAVQEIFPTLQRVVIELTDTQELESGWLAISRIIKNFKNTDYLERLVTPELLSKLLQVISMNDSSMSTVLRLIGILSICAQNNNLSIDIIKSGKLSESIISALGKYKKGNESNITIETLMAVPKDLTIAILDLMINLLPSETAPLLTLKPKTAKDYTSVSVEYKAFVNNIFGLLINFYQSTVLFDIRRRVSVCLVRIISSLDNINDLKNHLSIINLLASIVIQNKSIIRTEKTDVRPYIALLGALILTHTLIDKNPETFVTEFEREGLLSDTSSVLEILRQGDLYQELEDQDVEDEVMDDDNDEEIEEEEEDMQEDDHEDDDDGDESMQESNDSDDDEPRDEESDRDTYDDGEESDHSTVVEPHTIFREMDIQLLVKHLIKLASQIEQIYLSKKASGSSKLEHLRLLDEICAELGDQEIIVSYTRDDWLKLWNNFLVALAQENYVISSFELISSGVIEILSSLFRNPCYGSYDSVARTTFMEVFRADAFKTLVSKLQESLTRSESFDIVSCGLKTGENRAASLGKQLKLKLSYLPESNNDEDPATEQVDETAKMFEGMKNVVVLVHAIASFTNIGSFLRRRVENPFLFGLRRAEGVNKNWYVEFLLDGEVIPWDTTIYGALYKHAQIKNPNFDTNKFWFELHEVQYRKVEGTRPSSEITETYPETDEEELQNLKHPITIKILELLKVLHDLQPDASTESLFLNFKLTAKLNRQLEEPLIVASGILPNWSIHVTRKYPFLFPMETRIFFLQSTSFGYSRLIQLWTTKANQDNANSDNGDNNSNNSTVSLGRATRHKVRISREHLLKSAFKVMDKVGTHPSILEIEFTDEEGTGLGPTLEFYSNVSHAFAEKELGIWRDDDSGSEGYVHSTTGLFPRPLDPADAKFAEKVDLFKHLGKFIARALLDSRILDFNFNQVFFEICALEIEHQDVQYGLSKLEQVDQTLYKSLKYMQENPESVNDMEVYFTLPGFAIDLVEGGSQKMVESSNVEEYISLVVDYTLNKGIKNQVENFVIGFSEVFPYYSMLIFSPTELVELFGKNDEDWSYETLLSSIRADHGYNIDSPTVQNLLKLMSSFDLDERRAFLKFLTGSPRLPIGGFKNLRPEFTVVRKHEEDGLKADDYLPSVMTCANYLKLPNYSSLDVLKERLSKAVSDGADVFLLS